MTKCVNNSPSLFLLGLPTRLAVSYEPLECNVDIVLLLAGDGVAADLTVLKITIQLNLQPANGTSVVKTHHFSAASEQY
jgi:hypothetical protein